MLNMACSQTSSSSDDLKIADCNTPNYTNDHYI